MLIGILTLRGIGWQVFIFDWRRGDMEKLYSVQAAAEKLGGLSKWTIYAYLSSGKLKRTKVGGRTMIRESELMRLIHDETPAEAAERNIAAAHKRTMAEARPPAHRS
jgi:excisionase family DNA binding protein